MMYLPPPSGTIKNTRVFSFGGGVQSVAVLALQATGKLSKPYDFFVFANVGNDSESPKTLDYFAEFAQPFAAVHGIALIETQKTRFGKPETLRQALFRDNRSVQIPVYMNSGAPGNRTCTSDFKINVVDKWIRETKSTHAEIGLGISTDEARRKKPEHWQDRYWTVDKKGKPKAGKKYGFWKRMEHPLLDLRISRFDCHQIIESAGLPVPPPSKCMWCPFNRRSEWIEMKKFEPEIFAEAIAVQNKINEKRGYIGRDQVFLHPDGLLENAVGDQPSMFDLFMDTDNSCREGFCGF